MQLVFVVLVLGQVILEFDDIPVFCLGALVYVVLVIGVQSIEEGFLVI